MPEPSYDRKFFEVNRRGGRQAAKVVVPMVLDLLQPKSVCDVGSGIGAWLGVFMEQGVEDVFGVDGDYVPRDQLDIPPERFLAHDLSAPLAFDRKFDLVVSLEVAEHLPPESGPGFIESLVQLAPAVLFSAAVPNQGGRNHVNERWPEYWLDKFSRSGYVVVDCIRPRIWKEQSVHFWYRQNILLFVAPNVLDERPKLKAEYERSRSRPLSIVHPRLLEVAVGRPQRRHARLVELKENGKLSEEAFQAQRERLIEEVLGPPPPAR